MNMSDRCRALVIILLLFVFLVQCRPHEDIDVGTTRGRAAFSLTGTGYCDMERQNNKVVYCCSHPMPKHCYNTFQQCQANCYVRNRN
ncbi:hypothetical protein BDA96_10G012500 [Sorghum bicolor]|uniref:Uncharacterized protein n=1 Tax=Sorghum bicolor TaxID=4558 RepID=A0A921Q0U3_SORBI|nr:hypothetical protein BDA96_10G012500 [Sorghum bicolor]